MLRPLAFRKRDKKKACNRLDYRLFRWRRVRDSNPWSGMSRTTDFEQKAVSTAPPLSVPEMCNTSADFARNSKTNDFLREICEIDARKS